MFLFTTIDKILEANPLDLVWLRPTAPEESSWRTSF
jgi:hypothetical protein